MGILKEFQHKGFGKKLFETFKLYAQNNNYEFLQVKTVDDGNMKYMIKQGYSMNVWDLKN